MACRSWWKRYGIGLAVLAGAVGFELLIRGVQQPLLRPSLLGAVIVSAWYGGIGPGLLAAGGASLAALWFEATQYGQTLIGAFGFQDLFRLLANSGVAVLVGLLQASHQRAQAALSGSRELFRQFMDNMPVAAFVKDEQGRLLFINRKLQQVLRTDSTSYIGKTNRELFPPEIARLFDEYDRKVLDSGQVLEVEEVFPAEDGEHHWLTCEFTFGRPGEQRFLAGASLDMTAHRQVQAERDRLAEQRMKDMAAQESAAKAQRFMAEASAVLASSLDYGATLQHVVHLAVPTLADACAVLLLQDGKLERVAVAHGGATNPALFEEMLQRYPPRSDDANCVIMQAVQNRQSVLVSEVTPQWLKERARDEQHLRLMQEIGISSYMCIPLRAHGRVLGALTLLSMTPQRRYGAEDLALAEDLAARAALAVEHARLYADARSANAAKDQFLAVLSHEMRTPLTPVLVAVSMLLREQWLPADMRSMLEMVRRNVELQSRLIDDLLDVTRITRGKLHLDPCATDVHEIVRSAADTCAAELEAKGLTLNLDLTAQRSHVMADRSRLQQVVQNLLKNAIKFTPQGGAVTIRSRNAEPANSGRMPHLILEVADTGIGVQPDHLARIFEPFEQGGQEITHRYGGLGLGLAICKALVEAHGGRIRAESDGRDRGATFVIELSTVPRPQKSQESPPADLGLIHPAPLRVLLVEDHEDTAQTLAMLLRTFNCQVTTAGTAAQALSASKREQFDLLISDIGLPDGSGLDVVRHVRTAQGVQAVALSGYGMEGDLQRSREAGFAEHLVKPIDLKALEAVLNRARAKVNMGTPPAPPVQSGNP